MRRARGAALAAIEVIESDGLVENARQLGSRALERLQELKARHAVVGDVRGIGLLMGIELVKDRETKEPAVEEAEAVLYKSLSRGLSFKLSMGNIVTLTPPLMIRRQELDRAIDILDRSLAEVECG